MELLHQEKARILAANKELVAYTYRSKFASSKEAEEWGASTLLQFRSDYFGREPLLPHAEEPPISVDARRLGDGGILMIDKARASPEKRARVYEGEKEVMGRERK